jgi:hypothetical protein
MTRILLCCSFIIHPREFAARTTPSWHRVCLTVAAVSSISTIANTLLRGLGRRRFCTNSTFAGSGRARRAVLIGDKRFASVLALYMLASCGRCLLELWYE